MIASPPTRLLICVGPNCDAQGRGRRLLAESQATLAAAFPDALADGRLKISTRDCLRLCTRDPVVRLEPSGDVFADPDIDDLIEEVRRQLGADVASGRDTPGQRNTSL